MEQISSAVVVIKSFHELSPGVPSPAAAKVALGDALLGINGESVEFLTYKTLLQKIRASGRPLELRFAKWQNDTEHPGAPPLLNPQSSDVENPDPIQQALQMAARKRTKVYTGKNFGGHVALRKQERRCAAFIFVLLVFFMYFLYNRTASSVSGMHRSNIIQAGRLGNITKVDGRYVTVKLTEGNEGSEMKRLHHHFHALTKKEGEIPHA